MYDDQQNVTSGDSFVLNLMYEILEHFNCYKHVKNTKDFLYSIKIITGNRLCPKIIFKSSHMHLHMNDNADAHHAY